MSAETFYYREELETLSYQERWSDNAMEALREKCLRIDGRRWWVNKRAFETWRQSQRGRASVRGLGDHVENLLIRLGIKRAFVFVQRELKRPCGCAQRREWLNQQFPTHLKKKVDTCV